MRGSRTGRVLKCKLSRECPRIFYFPCSISQLFSQTREWFLGYANTKPESLRTFFSLSFIVPSQLGSGFPGAFRSHGQRKEFSPCNLEFHTES